MKLKKHIMQLQKINQNQLSPILKESEVRIVQASKGVAIQEIEPIDLYEKILAPFKELYIILGHSSPNAAESVMQCKLLVEKLKSSRQFIKVNEIILAMRSGACGDYSKNDQINHVSIANILKWIDTYQEQKHEAIKKQNDFETEIEKKAEEIRVHELKVKKYFEEFPFKVLAALKIYKETTEMNKLSWLMFETLEKLGAIEITLKQKLEIFEQAKIAEEITKSKMNSFDRRRLKFEPEESKTMRLKREAQKMAMIHVFKLWEDAPDEMLIELIEGSIENNIHNLHKY